MIRTLSIIGACLTLSAPCAKADDQDDVKAVVQKYFDNVNAKKPAANRGLFTKEAMVTRVPDEDPTSKGTTTAKEHIDKEDKFVQDGVASRHELGKIVVVVGQKTATVLVPYKAGAVQCNGTFELIKSGRTGRLTRSGSLPGWSNRLQPPRSPSRPNKRLQPTAAPYRPSEVQRPAGAAAAELWRSVNHVASRCIAW